MRILITNDDGIASPALPRLAAWTMKLGEVTVIAPRFEQSGKSHAIDFARQSEVKRADIGIECEAWSMDSTPADCVRFAMLGLKKDFDLVISGINRGFNLGHDIAYSGTVGAATEANNFGIKSIALSTDITSFDTALGILDEVYAYISDKRYMDHTDILNINIPDTAVKGMLVTRRGGAFYSDEFFANPDGSFTHRGQPMIDGRNDLTLDIDAVVNGYVSITPLTADCTDLVAYDKIRAI